MTALLLPLVAAESADPAYALAEAIRVATLLSVTVNLRLGGVETIIRPGAHPGAALERWTAAANAGTALALCD